MTIDKNQEIEDILNKQSYYDVLQVTKNASPQEIRRAYILKSRYCHPDKSPTHPKATRAFQT
ncbi:DnaJ protein, partial [Neoconidiobolus thromboides FSU 785]